MIRTLRSPRAPRVSHSSRLFLLLALCWLSGAAHAAIITVTSNADSGANTLRQALADASAGDTINFDMNQVVSPISLSSGLTIDKNLTISGPGADVLKVQEGDADQALVIFTVNSGVSAALSGLTISNGNNGIHNSGTLSVTNCTVSGNSGIGISNDSALSATNCTLSGGFIGIANQGGTVSANCTLSGGLVGIQNYSTLSATNCTISGNHFGITNYGTATIKNTICAGNSQNLGAGSVIQQGNNLLSGDTLLGALANNGGPTQTMRLLAGSPAIDQGLDSTPLTTDQRGLPRPVDIASSADVTGGDGSDIGAYELQGETVQSGPNFVVNTLDDTGAADACTDGDCTLREAINAANGDPDDSTITFASGLSGSITLTSALPHLSTNVTINGPGANVLTVQEGGAGRSLNIFWNEDTSGSASIRGLTISNGAEGIYNNGTLTVTNCTIGGNNYGLDNNDTLTATNCTIGGNDSGINNEGTLTATNCTLSGSANNGVDNNSGRTLTFTNCTVSGNTNTGINNNGTATIKNTICAGNTTNLSGTAPIQQGNNLVAEGSDPKLGSLQDNGGPTFTMLPLPGSPALDQGKDSAPLLTDQRGRVRPFDDAAITNANLGDGSDIGAVEVGEQTGSTLVVNSTADTNDGACTDSDCSLREAITLANANADASIITFKSGLHGTIQLANVLPDLDTNIALQGPGANVLTVRGEGAADPYRIFLVANNQTVTISGLTLANGQAPSVGGGAIANNHGTLTLLHCTLTGHAGDDGGAIYNAASTNADSLTVTGCTFSSNTAAFAGGAIYNDGFGGNAHLVVTGSTFAGNSTGGSGGAIRSTGANGAAALTVTGSTFTGNTATNDGGALLSDGSGGTATMSIVNSTFHDNTASHGGAIFNAGSGGLVTATVQNCTFNVNNAGFGGSAIWSSGPATSTVHISNNIFGVGVAGITLADDSNGSLISQGYNLASDGAGGYLAATGDRIDTDPLLDPAGLKNNGGPTQTIALLPLSPALGQADPASSPATDQRGMPRPQRATGHPDIGAFELEIVAIDDATVTEGDAGSVNANFHVNLSSPALRTLSVHVATVATPGTATPGSDYLKLANTIVTFQPGDISKIVTVPVLGDTTYETLETFKMMLSQPFHCGLKAGGGGGTILNDDAPPQVSVSDPGPIPEGRGGSTPMAFTLSLNAPSARPVTVTFAFGGTATKGVDYIYGVSFARTFQPGETSKTVTVSVLGDTLSEADETVRLTVTNAPLATIAKKLGIGTILDDDARPTLSINNMTQAEGSSGATTACTFTVTLSLKSGQPVTVHYATADGTATQPWDYTIKAGTLSFAPGETTKTITVPVKGDTLFEPDETFVVSLSSPVNATLATGQGTGTIQNDD